MATIASYLKRPTAIMKMPQAIARGLTPTKFLSQLRLQGLGYRKQRFLADWRNVSGVEKRKGAMKYVRRGYKPPIAAMADVDWEMSEDYMYKLRVWVREQPGEPLTERFINIQSSRLLTPEEQEAQVEELWADRPDQYPEELERVQAYEGYHKIPELDPE